MMLRWILNLISLIKHQLGLDGWLDADYVEVEYE